MNIALQRPWTQQEFFAWAAAQETRHEFDGFRPVAMTGGSINSNAIVVNILSTLRARLRGTSCRPLGPDAGVVTLGNAVRYPDALVTCTPLDGQNPVVPAPVIVFEVISRNSSNRDRTIKLQEYAALASILQYVIVESTSIGLTLLSRTDAAEPWTTTSLTEPDALAMPGIGIEIPVIDFYEDVDLTTPEPGS